MNLGETSGGLQIKSKEAPVKDTVSDNKEVVEEKQKETETSTVSKKKRLGDLDNEVYKVDLSKKKEELEDKKEESTDEDEKSKEELQGEKANEVDEKEEGVQVEESDNSVIELVSDEEDTVVEKKETTVIEDDNEQRETVEDKKEETAQVELNLPENIQKVVDFMNDNPSASLDDYVRLNTDFSKLDDNAILKEYYKQTQPHLDSDDIAFKIDEFGYDEEVDYEKDIRRKKLQFKEELGKARKHLEGLKDKYYDEVKLKSTLNPEQKEAVEFYNSYKVEQKSIEENQLDFADKTTQLFGNDFKGFDFKVGDNTYRYKVSEVDKVKEAQSDFTNIYGKYFDEKSGKLKDPKGYHKALFVAENAESIAEHFYNQGKAEAIKEMNADDKNITMNARKDHNSTIRVKGTTVTAVKGEDSTKLKIKSNFRGRK